MNKYDTIEADEQNNIRCYYIPNFVTVTMDSHNYYLSCGVTVPQISEGITSIIIREERV